MRRFFKLITIGNEVRYPIEFGLEDAQQLCATAFPLHMLLELQLYWSNLSVGITALLVQPQRWKNSQPLGKREGWGGLNMGGWMCLILSINREPTSGSVVDHHHQLTLFNAAHQITSLLPVISTYVIGWL
jgi:hypothetical protein